MSNKNCVVTKFTFWGEMKLVWVLVAVLFQATINSAIAATEIDFAEKFQAQAKVKDSYEEIGVINEVNYHIMYNGTGIFAGSKNSEIQGAGYDYRRNWRVLCEKNEITDSKRCTLLRPDISITAFPNGKLLVLIGANHFPGTKVYLRIDGQPANTANSPGFGFDVSADLVNKIKTAKEIKTRFTEWPYEYPVDQSLTTFGFNEALQYMLWAVARIK